MRFEEAKRKLAEMLPNEVYAHCLRTSEFAARLASEKGVDPSKAAWAGLLHDVARAQENSVLLRTAAEMGIIVDSIESRVPVLLHGPVGAEIARREFEVEDRQVLHAIAIHSTGGPSAGPLDKVIFIADKVEPGRTWSDVKNVRSMVELGSLDDGFALCLASTIKWLLDNRALIHPDSLAAWNECIAARDERQ
ncbi:MAG TPA: HD domain-containing protein [Firmicutes bacterium]|nr:HD domain-containing protein [Bacillota bacterium]